MGDGTDRHDARDGLRADADQGRARRAHRLVRSRAIFLDLCLRSIAASDRRAHFMGRETFAPGCARSAEEKLAEALALGSGVPEIDGPWMHRWAEETA